MKKIFKRFIMSVAICFPLVFTFMMISSIIGLPIALLTNLLIFSVLSIGFTLLYDINELRKIFKRFIISVAISFSLVFTLMLINLVMGLFIQLDFYLLLLGVLMIGFTVALILFDSNVIFSYEKPKQSVRRKSITNKTRKIESHSKVRRKIS